MPNKGEPLGQITITYKGPGDCSVDPPTGFLNRDVQTMTWTLVDKSGLNARLKNPTGGIVFLDPDPPAYSRWSPPGTQPAGSATVYTASANDRIPHGNAAKKYAYDIVIERDSTDGASRGEGEAVTEERIPIRANAAGGAQLDAAAGGDVVEVIDPPIENEPQP